MDSYRHIENKTHFEQKNETVCTMSKRKKIVGKSATIQCDVI